MRYTAYGLNIESDIELEEFSENNNLKDTDIDVRIFKSEIDSDIKEKIEEGKIAQGNWDKMWFYIKDTAAYKISDGKEIRYTPMGGENTYKLKIFLECSSIGFILFQRRMLALHAGTVIINNKAAAICGERGAGKSSLTTALRKKGFGFLADDISVTCIENGIPYIVPGFPYQKLCEGAMNNFNEDKEKCFSFMSDSEMKYLVPVKDLFSYEKKEFDALIYLTKGDVREPEIKEIKGTEKFKVIMDNIYRIEIGKAFGTFPQELFKQCMQISQHIKVYNIIRPQTGFTVDKQIKLIEKELLEN